jgi:putative ABC transport system ATP-binding protein
MIRLDKVSRIYRRGLETVTAVTGATFDIQAGEFCAITGPSGSGKTTLLNLLGLLDQPTTGGIFIDEERVCYESADKLARLRNRKIGFVFQGFHLLPRLNAVENVALPLLYRGIERKEAHRIAARELARLGLGDRSHHRPDELSGGQRQRVAICRALVGQPSIMLADEPTAALDGNMADQVIETFDELRTNRRIAVLIVTHDLQIAARCDRQIRIEHGSLVAEMRPPVLCGA